MLKRNTPFYRAFARVPNGFKTSEGWSAAGTLAVAAFLCGGGVTWPEACVVLGLGIASAGYAFSRVAFKKALIKRLDGDIL